MVQNEEGIIKRKENNIERWLIVFKRRKEYVDFKKYCKESDLGLTEKELKEIFRSFKKGKILIISKNCNKTKILLALSEYFIKYDTGLNKRRSDLCQKSIDFKWNSNSELYIQTPCPFCSDYMRQRESNKSYECICPNEICDMCKGDSGNSAITKMSKKYGEWSLVSAMSKEDKEYVQNLFKKHIIIKKGVF